MAGRFSVEATIKANDRLTRPVLKMGRETERFGRRASRAMAGANRLASRFMSGLKGVGIAAGTAGAALGLIGRNIVGVGMEFEQTLINAAAKFPGEVNKGTAAFQKLEDTAKRIGSETEFTSAAAAEGLNFLAMAGFNAEQSVAALPGVVDLATAAQVELGQASDVATDSLGAFNLMSKDAAQLGKNLARVNDVIAKTTTTANTDVEQLFEAMKNGGPVATSAGASLETFAAMAGELANAGIKGSAAGNTLKNMFARLAAPPTEAAGALKKLKIETLDANKNLRDVPEILGELNEKMKGMGTGEKSGFLTDIFGLRAVAGANVLLASGEDKLKSYRGALEGASGASAAMAAKMRDSTANDFKSFESAVEGVKIAVFDVVKGPLREVVQSMIAWTRANKDMIATKVREFVQWIKDNLPEIIKWGKRIAVVVGVFVTLAAVVKTVAAALAVLVPVGKFIIGLLSSFMLPLTLFVAALVIFWPQIKAFFKGLWETIKSVAVSIADFFVGIWNSVAGFMGPIWESIKSFAEGAFEFIVGIATLYFGYLKAIWTPVIAVFKFIWDTVVAAATFYFNALKVIFQPLIDVFVAIWNAVAEQFSAAWDRMVVGAHKFVAVLKKIWEPLKGFFAKLWDGIVDTFKAVLGPVLDAIMKAVKAVQDIGKDTLGKGDQPGKGGSKKPGSIQPVSFTPQVVSTTAAAVSRSIEESQSVERAELTINDPTGRAVLSKPPKGASRIRMQRSGEVYL